MKLVKDNSPGSWAVKVPCIHPQHEGESRMFTLAEGWSDIEGKAFVDYYCLACVDRFGLLRYSNDHY